MVDCAAVSAQKGEVVMKTEDRGQRTDDRKAGYYLMARRIDESPIARMPPHVREIWHLLIRKAMWRDGTDLKRGQLLTTYKQIQEDLHWTVGYRKHTYEKHHIQTALDLLAAPTPEHTTAHPMIRKAKTTRGILITVLNYDVYQNFETYETYSGTDLEPTWNLRETVHDREVKNTEKEVIEREGVRRAYEILISEPSLSSLTLQQFMTAIGDRPAELDSGLAAIAIRIKTSASLMSEEINNPGLWVASRIAAAGKKKDAGDSFQKKSAPAAPLLERPEGTESMAERVARWQRQLQEKCAV